MTPKKNAAASKVTKARPQKPKVSLWSADQNLRFLWECHNSMEANKVNTQIDFD